MIPRHIVIAQFQMSVVAVKDIKVTVLILKAYGLRDIINAHWPITSAGPKKPPQTKTPTWLEGREYPINDAITQ